MTEGALGVIVTTECSQKVIEIESQNWHAGFSGSHLTGHVQVPPRAIGQDVVEKHIHLVRVIPIHSCAIQRLHSDGSVGKVWVSRKPLGQKIAERGRNRGDSEGITHGRVRPDRRRRYSSRPIPVEGGRGEFLAGGCEIARTSTLPILT